MKPRVLLDVDGVLADFVGAFLDVVRHQLGRDHAREEVTAFGLANSLSLSKYEFDQCAIVVGKNGFCASLDVYPGAIDGVRRLQEVADVYIVTSPWNTNPTWTHDRENWLKRHFDISHSRIVHTSAKHLVRGHFLVDDKTETLVKWQAENEGTAIQWATPHNRLDGWTGLSTCSWDELCAAVDRHELAAMSPVPPLELDCDDIGELQPAVTRAPAVELDDGCERCAAGEESVWDSVLECYAHACPGGALAVCNDAWRASR